MKAVVVYDSADGNTEKVAQALANSISPPDVVELSLVNSTTLKDLQSADLLIVGSPTQGGRPTKKNSNLFK